LCLALTVSSLPLVQGQDCTEVSGCSDIHDVAKISCKTGELCEIDPPELDYLLDTDMKFIDALTCAKKCQKQNKNETEEDAKRCLFYRWGFEGHDVGQRTIYCSLQTNNGVIDSSCDGSSCRCGEVNCKPDGTPLPTEACKISEATQYNKTKVHITCLTPAFEDFNIYDKEKVNKEIDVGTWCITTRRCADWNEEADEAFYRKLGIICKEDGTWKAMDNTGNQELSAAMYDNTKKIFVEPECEAMQKGCASMMLTHTDQRGLRLMCNKPIRDNTLTDHSCILTCDNHFMMGIDCKMSEDGEKVWLDNNGEVVTDDRVRCWGRSK